MADKVLAITGGASGIGLAIAEAALAEGWRVPVADRDEAALEWARGRLDPTRSVIAALDATDEPAIEGWIAGLSASGRLTGAVAAAGIAADVPALDTPVDLFRRILEVNVTGSFCWPVRPAAPCATQAEAAPSSSSPPCPGCGARRGARPTAPPRRRWSTSRR